MTDGTRPVHTPATHRSAQGPPMGGEASYVTFRTAGETYAVPTESVRGVIPWVPVTRVPDAAPSVKGVINLRGEIVSVLDVRSRFGLPTVDPTDRTCIVVVNAEHAGNRLQVGLIVDTALDVTRLPHAELRLRSEGDPALAGEYVTGVASTKAGLLMVLDVDRLVPDGGDPQRLRRET